MDDSRRATTRGRAAVRGEVGASKAEDQAVRAGGGEPDGVGGEVARLCDRGDNAV